MWMRGVVRRAIALRSRDPWFHALYEHQASGLKSLLQMPSPSWSTLGHFEFSPLEEGGSVPCTQTSSFQLLLPLVSALKIPVAIDEVSVAPSFSLGGQLFRPQSPLPASTQLPFQSLTHIPPHTPTLIALGGSNNGVYHILPSWAAFPFQHQSHFSCPHLTEPDLPPSSPATGSP